MTMRSDEFKALKNAHQLAHSTTMPFGPYEGMAICELPLRYLVQIQDDIILAPQPDIQEVVKLWLQAIGAETLH